MALQNMPNLRPCNKFSTDNFNGGLEICTKIAHKGTGGDEWESTEVDVRHALSNRHRKVRYKLDGLMNEIGEVGVC